MLVEWVWVRYWSADIISSMWPKRTTPSELGGLGLEPDWLCHCSWSAQKVVSGMDDDTWGTLAKGTFKSLTKLAPYWLPSPLGALLADPRN